MDELKEVLAEDEKILWEGAPKFWPFYLSRSVATTIFGVFWMAFIMIFIVATLASNNGPLKYAIFLLPHFWIGIIILFGPPIYNALVYKHTYYAITDKRVIFQKGLIARRFESVDFDQVTNTEVVIGVFDRLFGGNTGSILISTAGSFTYTRQGAVTKPYTISNIYNPYDVYKFFEKVEHDTKTDIEYPNAFRPKENPGYRTEYDPNESSKKSDI